MVTDAEQLFYDIGKEAFDEEGMGISYPSWDVLRRAGYNRLVAVRETVCGALQSNKASKVLEALTQEDNQAFWDLVDILSSITVGIPPRMLARAVLILGKDWFCKEPDDKVSSV